MRLLSTRLAKTSNSLQSYSTEIFSVNLSEIGDKKLQYMLEPPTVEEWQKVTHKVLRFTKSITEDIFHLNTTDFEMVGIVLLGVRFSVRFLGVLYFNKVYPSNL